MRFVFPPATIASIFCGEGRWIWCGLGTVVTKTAASAGLYVACLYRCTDDGARSSGHATAPETVPIPTQKNDDCDAGHILAFRFLS
jgi:hypothetical protein